MRSDNAVHRDSVPTFESIDEGLANLLTGAANAYRDGGIYAHAAALAEAASLLDEGGPEPLLLLLIALQRQGAVSQALDCLHRLVARPDVRTLGPSALADAAEAALDLGDISSAEALAAAVATASRQDNYV